MATIPPIRVEVVADTSGLKTGLAQAEQGIKKMDDSVKTASTGMANFTTSLKKVGAAMGVAFAGAQLAKFAKESIMAASDMAESVSKVNVVFAGTSEAVLAFGKTAADNLGISSQAALEATGTYGNLFQALGVGKDKAQDMSINMVKLAADLSSFNNMPITDSLNALRSGLSGETEPLKRFGIALNDVTLRNKAMTMGFGEIKGVMDPAIKSQVTYALVMEQTALAQGDYARTADGAANTMKSLTAKFEDAKVAIGNALMPAFRALLALLKLLIPIIEGLGKFFTENATALKMYAIIIGSAAIAFYSYRAAIIATKVTQQAFIVIQTLMKGATLASIASTNGLAASMLVLNAAMRANPIGLIVTALMLVGAAFVYAWKKSETFRGIVIKGVQVIMNWWAFLLGGLAKLLTLFSKMPGMGWAKGIADGAQKAADSIKNTSKNLSDLKSQFATTGTPGAIKNGNAGSTTEPTVTSPTAAAIAKAKADAKKKEEALAKHAKQVKEIYKDMNEVIADANEKAAEALANRNEKMADASERALEQEADLRKRFAEQMADADERYLEATAEAYDRQRKAENEANKRFKKAELDIQSEYTKKITSLEENLHGKLADLREKAANKTADLMLKASEKQANIVQQSMSRLQSAFASKTGFNLAEAFKGGSVDALLNDLKTKLQGAKDLQANAAALAGMGYSQTFIEQVVKEGPEAGNAIAVALKSASAQATIELQTLYKDVETISDTGLDQLAKTMNAGGNLATQELMDAYTQVAVDLKESLATVDAELQVSLAEANSAYASAMVEAKALRDEKLMEADAQLKEAIAAAQADLIASLADADKTLKKAQLEAQKSLNEGLADVQKTLQKALLDAQKDYEKAIDEINKSTMKKLEELKAKLAEVAAAMAALGAAQAAAAAMASAPVYTPIVATPSASDSSASSSSNSTTVNITGVNLTDPYNTTTSVVNAIKFGNVVVPVAPSALAAEESGAIGAKSIASRTYTVNGNTSKGRVGR